MPQDDLGIKELGSDSELGITPIQQSPGLLERAGEVWNAANKPLIDIRSGGLKTATDEFAAEHPLIGKPMNFATDVLSSLTSPLSVGLGALTVGGSIAESAGLSGLAKGLEVPGKVAAGGMVGHGGYNLVRPSSSPEERVGGALEAGLGGLGLRSGKSSTVKRLDKLVESDKKLMPGTTNTLEEIDLARDRSASRRMGSFNEKLGLPSDNVPKLDLPSDVNPAVNINKSASEKLLSALGESKPLNAQQRELYRAERGEKFSKASEVSVKSEEDLPKFFGALKGKHTKVDITPLRESLTQPDINELLTNIGESPLTVPEQANAFKGLEKLLFGQVPTDYDITQLGRVFGEDFSKSLQKQLPWTARRILLEAGSIPKALKSAGDFGLPFRQGRNYAYRASWFKSMIPMMKAYGSQAVYDTRMSMLHERPLFNTARDAGIDFADLANRTAREENAISSAVGNAPLVKQSNRAATIFANELRMNEFESQYNKLKKIYESGMKIAKTPEEVQAAKLSNPDNPYVASKLADQINTATGRGKLPGNLEKIAPELNAFVFSPKLISSRIRSMNRIFQGAMNPLSGVSTFERKEAAKQLMSIAAAGASEAMITYEIAKAAGYDPSIELSPNSSDFLKVKIGNTRYDPWGGYQQYFTPVFKILTGKATSTTDGTEYELGKGRGYRQSGWTVATDALANKASPATGLGIAALKGSEPGGRKLDFTNVNPFENTIGRYLTNPIIVQDIYELINEDPNLLPLAGLDMFGQGVQVYDHK